MIPQAIALIAFGVALRGSYLGRKASTDEEKIKALLHTAMAVTLAMLSLVSR
jgi:hypothetical protein